MTADNNNAGGAPTAPRTPPRPTELPPPPVSPLSPHRQSQGQAGRGASGLSLGDINAARYSVLGRFGASSRERAAHAFGPEGVEELARGERLYKAAKHFPDDLWAELVAKDKAAHKKRLPKGIIRDIDQRSEDVDGGGDDNLENIRKRYAAKRAAKANDRKWPRHNYYLKIGIQSPDYQPGESPKGVDPTNGKTPDTWVVPSAGPLMDPVKRPLVEFVADVRQDMLTPMRRPQMVPRGLRNPGNLCYRNSVLTALLNTPRFLSFLYTHARYIRTYMACKDVNHHLLTRLYHLALAYWERAGIHPIGDDGPAAQSSSATSSGAKSADNYEKFLALFWRACKTDTDMGQQDDPRDNSYRDSNGREKQNWVNESWLDVCWRAEQENSDERGGYDAVEERDYSHHQQDAAEFLTWLVEMGFTQLYYGPARYAASRASQYYESIFHMYVADRKICTMCKRPVRLRRGLTVREPCIRVKVAQVGETANGWRRPSGRGQKTNGAAKPTQIGDLARLVHAALVEDVEGNRCERCGKTPKAIRHVKTLQTAPEILNVQLDRTARDGRTHALFKSQNVVDVPEYLDVSRHLERHIFAKGTRIVYRLAAVVSHIGNTVKSGHYVSFVRHDAKQARRAFVPVSEPADIDIDKLIKEADDRKKLVADAMQKAKDDIVREAAADPSAARRRTKAEMDAQNVEESKRYRAVERIDSDWAMINDSWVMPGIPYTRIFNTSLDPMHHPDIQDSENAWFDPVVLVYEKVFEKFVTDDETGNRVYQVPMNRDWAAPDPEDKTTIRDALVDEQGAPVKMPYLYKGLFHGDHSDAVELSSHLVRTRKDKEKEKEKEKEAAAAARAQQSRPVPGRAARPAAAQPASQPASQPEPDSQPADDSATAAPAFAPAPDPSTLHNYGSPQPATTAARPPAPTAVMEESPTPAPRKKRNPTKAVSKTAVPTAAATADQTADPAAAAVPAASTSASTASQAKTKTPAKAKKTGKAPAPADAPPTEAAKRKRVSGDTPSRREGQQSTKKRRVGQ